jgi:branched-chain amino acid transport system permease protein
MYDILASATPEYWSFWLGLALVLLVLFARGGIIGLLTALRERFERSRAGRA